MFERHSWYFRNALVRANYRNLEKNINYEPVFLVRFFRNLLLGENNLLKNRYMMVDAPEEWKMPDDKIIKGQVPEQVQDLFQTNNPLITRLVALIGQEEKSISELMKALGLKHRPNFIEYHLSPSMQAGFVRMLYPDSPRHPRQKYLLTVKGLALYHELKK